MTGNATFGGAGTASSAPEGVRAKLLHENVSRLFKLQVSDIALVAA